MSFSSSFVLLTDSFSYLLALSRSNLLTLYMFLLFSAAVHLGHNEVVTMSFTDLKMKQRRGGRRSIKSRNKCSYSISPLIFHSSISGMLVVTQQKGQTHWVVCENPSPYRGFVTNGAFSIEMERTHKPRGSGGPS